MVVAMFMIFSPPAAAVPNLIIMNVPYDLGGCQKPCIYTTTILFLRSIKDKNRYKDYSIE